MTNPANPTQPEFKTEETVRIRWHGFVLKKNRRCVDGSIIREYVGHDAYEFDGGRVVWNSRNDSQWTRDINRAQVFTAAEIADVLYFILHDIGVLTEITVVARDV